MRTAYLSIDLDYGNRKLTQLFRILRFAKNLKVSTSLVEFHEELLIHAIGFQFDTLLNVDEHSDLTYDSEVDADRLHCGNWVNFVDAEEYVWLRSAKEEDGRCDRKFKKLKPFETVETQFKKQSTSFGCELPILKSFQIVGVGIAVSDNYTKPGVLAEILENPVIQSWFDEIEGPSPRNYNVVQEIEKQWLKNKRGIS